MGELDPATEAGERAMAIAEELDELPLRMVVSGHFAALCAARGNHHRASEILDAAVERLRGDIATEMMGTTGVLGVFMRGYLACSLAELGEFERAARSAREAVEIAETANQVYSLAFSYYCKGNVLTLQGEVSQGIAVLEQALNLARSWTLPLVLPLIGVSLGHAYCLAGRTDEAIALLEETEREGSAMHRLGGHAMILVRLGEAYLRGSRTADAERTGRRALLLARKQGEYGYEALALRLLAELGLGDPSPIDESETNFLEALRKAEEFDLRPLAAQCHLGLGKRYKSAGQSGSAEQHLKTAATLFGELGMQFWLEQAQAQLASTA
jgi:tetratricopeptide (TPR) repeat protein